MARFATLLLAGALSCGVLHGCTCSRGAQDGPGGVERAEPVDRLAPGELAPGSASVFGLTVPRSLRVAHQFVDSALLVGRADSVAVAEDLRRQLRVRDMEVVPGKFIFARARIKGDRTQRLYDIEVIAEKRGNTRVTITNVTPPPSSRGLTEEQRWKQAGRNADGTLLDRKNIY